jgi:hypothetical protein
MFTTLFEGLRIAKRIIRVRLSGFKRYDGDSKDICDRIIRACWNGRYFQASAGHFSGFWTRDFGWCADSLVKLGCRKECVQTLAYALERFSKAGRITTTIAPNGVPFDFPRFSPDSLPFLVRALNASGAHELVKERRAFLRRQVRNYAATVLDRNLVRDAKFSSMKDGVFRHRSAYDTAMVGMLAKELDTAGIAHSFPDMGKTLREHYWTGRYFLDDLSGKTHIAGDAQVFPFWTGVIQDAAMMKTAFASLHNVGLDTPFPLKYTAKPLPANVISQRVFVPNYEGNTIWAHMGLLYIHLLREVNPALAQKHVEAYKKQVEQYGTFLELYEPHGKKPYRSLFYAADEGMLWAANLRVLL